MELANIHAGDVLVMDNGDLACVIDIKPDKANPIIFQMKVGKTYVGKPGIFLSRVGTVDLLAFNTAMQNKSQQTLSALDELSLPPVLRGVKIGDPIQVRHGWEVRTVTFEGFNSHRPKWPLTYSLPTGGKYKGRVDQIVPKV